MLTDEVIEIHHPYFSATVLKQGAQLIHFQPKGKGPLLWSSTLSTFKQGVPFRGGIPICWPWFGKHSSPSHGFARILEWTLEKRVDADDHVALSFGLRDSVKTYKIWPHPFKLNLEIIFKKLSVVMKLSVQTSVPTTGALHSYLYADDISELSIDGLGKNYFDALDTQIKSDSDKVKITEETDRIYMQPSNVTRLTGSRNGVIKVNHYNCSDVVLWNPWQVTSSSFLDMKDNDFRKMVCIETARINTSFDGNDTLGCEIGYEIFEE